MLVVLQILSAYYCYRAVVKHNEVYKSHWSVYTFPALE